VFPDICSKTENGFVGDENCFIGTSQRNNPGRKFNVFNVTVFWNAAGSQQKQIPSKAVRLSQLFCGNRPHEAGNGEPDRSRCRLNRVHATFLSSCALSHTSRRRIAVVGNGNIDVGSKTATRLTGQPIVERLADSRFPDLRIDSQNPSQNPLQRNRAGKCGAMSEQSADSGRGNESVPQKLVQLVGYRDPNAGPDPWVRPRPIPVKR
jgi:hypothetical protein